MYDPKTPNKLDDIPIRFGVATFVVGETLMIKGESFRVQDITPDMIVLRGIGKTKISVKSRGYLKRMRQKRRKPSAGTANTS